VDCTCEQPSMCVSESAGHSLSTIQLRVASATPSKWVDATVHAVHADGRAVLAPTFGGADVTVWNHAGLAHVLAVGDPVALHSVYNVLAVGARRLNVVAG
jgi:hypothetical protein